MVSTPAFVVEINKGGDKTLAIHCIFPHPEDVPPPSEQDQHEHYGMYTFILLSSYQEGCFINCHPRVTIWHVQLVIMLYLEAILGTIV